MSADHTSIAVILYKSKTLANGEHPLMIRVTQHGVRKYVTLGISSKIKDWDFKVDEPKKGHPHRSLIDSVISNIKSKYKAQILTFKQEGKDFTPDFLIASVNKPFTHKTVFEYFESRINDLEVSNLGNASVYKDTYNQLKTFQKNKDITFSQIDYRFLVTVETFFKRNRLTDNTMSVRFRTLRALFNSAILEGYAKKEMYPFDNFKISARFNNKTQKRALLKEDLKKIESVALKLNSAHFEAQQYFLFSYYGQGINFVDIAHLKWSNLINGRIFYKRAKTGNEITFKVPEPALSIIEYWRPITQQPKSSYIFPILNESIHISPKQMKDRIRKVRARYNKSLKHIAELAQVDAHLTSYVARHTFATVLKNSGVSTAIISESMGHQTEAITQTYLKSFENSIIDEAMENLL